MIKRDYVLAIDIGASSGRHIVGYMEGNELRTQEVYRFSNGVTSQDGHLVWDIGTITDNVIRGIGKARELFPQIKSLSIDTWGVDYVLMKGDEAVLPVYAYRDERTKDVIDEVHSKVPFETLYERTGSQFQAFNTLYQLYCDAKCGRLEGVTDFLMIPEYLMYRLTGIKSKEFTNATTTGLVNAKTLGFDMDIVRRLGLPSHLFTDLSQPGTVIGQYEGMDVMLCATHDTASAVCGIPMEKNSLYLSSGTWSLLGVKTDFPLTDEKSRNANFSNEGGIGYNRYQKNIMGMWLINRLRDELCPGEDFGKIVSMAEKSSFERTVDADSQIFLAPKSMKCAFDEVLGEKNLAVGDYFRCAYMSLAESYAKAVREIECNTGRSYDDLYIVGGGAKNAFLNSLTKEASKKNIIALPIEATAIGNLSVQIGLSEE